MRCHYETLSVDYDATPDGIKAAFRRLAMKWHPDRNQNNSHEAERVFKEVKFAYETLSDPIKRATYDRAQGRHSSRKKAAQAPEKAAVDPDEEIFDEFIRQFSEGAKPRSRSEKNRSHEHDATDGMEAGADVEVTIKISLEEAVSGVDYRVDVNPESKCKACLGSGKSQPSTCIPCRGKGVSQQKIYGPHGSAPVRCKECDGMGQRTPACVVCKGTGKQREKNDRSVNVRVPPGVFDGVVLRVSGAGGAGLLGGPAGNLLCTIRLLPHPVYEVKDKYDLVMSYRIDPLTALVGGNIEIDSLYGKVPLEVPPMTEYLSELRIPEYGLRNHKNGSGGDLIVQTLIDIPLWMKTMTGDQRRRIAEIRNSLANQ